MLEMIGEILFANGQRRGSLNQRREREAPLTGGESHVEVTENSCSNNSDGSNSQPENLAQSGGQMNGQPICNQPDGSVQSGDGIETQALLQANSEMLKQILDNQEKFKTRLQAMKKSVAEILSLMTSSMPVPSFQQTVPKASGGKYPGAACAVPTSTSGILPSGDGTWLGGESPVTTSVMWTQASSDHLCSASNGSSLGAPPDQHIPRLPQQSSALCELNPTSSAVAVPSSNSLSTESLNTRMITSQAAQEFISKHCPSSCHSRLTLEVATSRVLEKTIIVADDRGGYHMKQSREESNKQLVPFHQGVPLLPPEANTGLCSYQTSSRNGLTEPFLSKLAGMFGSNWTHISIQTLGFTYDEITNFKSGNTSQDAVFIMLKKWKNRVAKEGKATITHLREVLYNSEDVSPEIIDFLESHLQ